MVHVLGITRGPLGAPHKPKLEDVIVSAALDHFVARIEANVVVFVLLEQVVGTHLITIHEQVLFIWAHRLVDGCCLLVNYHSRRSYSVRWISLA